MKKNFLVVLCCCAAIMFTGIALYGCAGKTDLLSEISGSWEMKDGNGSSEEVQINLSGENKAIVIDGQSYPAEVEKIIADKYQVDLNVQNGNGEVQNWTLRQVWDDSGSNFRIALNRNGTKEMLTSKS